MFISYSSANMISHSVLETAMEHSTWLRYRACFPMAWMSVYTCNPELNVLTFASTGTSGCQEMFDYLDSFGL